MEALATELLKELKQSAKRWFIAFLVMVVIEAMTIGGFVWYMTLPTEEYTIEQDADDSGYNLINSGGSLYNGRTPESDIQTQGR